MVSSQENEPTVRQAAFRDIVQIFVERGKREYDRGDFENAVITFVSAQKYEDYLTVDGREELRALREKARTAVAKRKLALEKFHTADQLFKQERLIEAKTHFEDLRNNKFLNKYEHAQITAELKQIDIKISNKTNPKITAEKPEKIKEEITKTNEQQTRRNQRIADLYRSSMKLYRAGQFEKAREGLAEVATSGLIPTPMKKTIEKYLAQIDQHLQQEKAAISNRLI